MYPAKIHLKYITMKPLFMIESEVAEWIFNHGNGARIQISQDFGAIQYSTDPYTYGLIHQPMNEEPIKAVVHFKQRKMMNAFITKFGDGVND